MARTMSTLIEGATVLSVDARRPIIEPGSVLVREDRIAGVGTVDEVRAFDPRPDQVIDARGRILLPGFVSAHNHLGYAVFRGRAEDIGFDATHRLYLPMATVIAREERQAVGNHALVELLRGGVTTILEMEEDADLFAPFIQSIGMRAGLGIMMSDLDLERLGQRELVFDEAIRARQLEQAVGLVESCHGRGDGRIQGVFAATGISTSSRELLRELRRQADRLGVRISIHLGFGEKALVREAHGREQLDMADEMGLLASDVVAVHCYDMDEDEITRLGKSGAHLAHCPLMNQFRGEIAPIEILKHLGMNVGLGIDNYFSDYFDLLRACIASARIRARDPSVLSAMEVIALGTIDAARALGLDDQIGSIEVGKKADLQLVNLRQPGLTPAADVAGTLVYHAHARDVEWVMVDGKVLVHDARIQVPGADEEQLLSDAERAAAAAWKRFSMHYGGYAAPAPLDA